jgi:hypothetical protein
MHVHGYPNLPSETVQHNNVGSANLLIHQKVLDVGSLIPLKLNDLLFFIIFLNSSVTRKILLKGFADALNVQIIGETCHGRDTLAAISLLNSNMNFLFGAMTTVSGVFKSVCDTVAEQQNASLCVRETLSQVQRASRCRCQIS